MSASNPLHRQLSDRTERLALILGAIVSWVLLALLFRYATTRVSTFTATLIGPCVLLLTFFACGGEIPRKLRQRRFRRLMLVPVVFWISFVAAVIVDRFGH